MIKTKQRGLSEGALNELRNLINEMNESHVPIIVEGRKDVKALRKIGIEGKIIKLNSGKSIVNFCEDVARDYDEVILLLDWDRKGEELTEKTKKILQSYGTKCILKYRKTIARIFPYASAVEEITI